MSPSVTMIRVEMPQHLRTLAQVPGEVQVQVAGPVTQRAVLDALNPETFDHIILVSDAHLPIQEADAQTLITLLHLRAIADARNVDLSIVSEMMDLRNRALAQVAKADDFMKPLQQYLTEHAWGSAWTRPGLDLKTRSMLTLAMLAALNRPHELRIHLRGAIRNGVTKEQMQEIFLQCGVYCGAPAALEAFKIAKEVLAEPVDKP